MPKQNISQLAREHGLNAITVHSRIRKGMTLEQALSEPPKGYFKRQWESDREGMLQKGRQSRLKTYEAISPEGNRIVIKDLPEFCAKMDLPYPSVSLYIRWGKPYRRWTIRKLSDATQKASNPTE